MLPSHILTLTSLSTHHHLPITNPPATALDAADRESREDRFFGKCLTANDTNSDVKQGSNSAWGSDINRDLHNDLQSEINNNVVIAADDGAKGDINYYGSSSRSSHGFNNGLNNDLLSYGPPSNGPNNGLFSNGQSCTPPSNISTGGPSIDLRNGPNTGPNNGANNGASKDPNNGPNYGSNRGNEIVRMAAMTSASDTVLMCRSDNHNENTYFAAVHSGGGGGGSSGGGGGGGGSNSTRSDGSSSVVLAMSMMEVSECVRRSLQHNTYSHISHTHTPCQHMLHTHNRL